MKASELMTPSPCVSSPADSLAAAARLTGDKECLGVP